MRAIGGVGLWVVVLAAAGCSASHTTGEGPACGPVRCASDQVCCNASCGICTAPGEGCIEIGCILDGGAAPDAGSSSCGPMDARGEGPCHAILGWVWDGTSCVSIGGCECVGAACDRVYGSASSCRADHEACVPECGGFGGRECPPGFFCDYPDRWCGGDDSTGTCRARPDDCPEPGGVAVCGCDGRDYVGECSANLAGTDVAFVGACGAPPVGSAAAWRECGPADGPAWRIELSESARSSCDARPPGTLVIEVWGELEGTAPRTISIDGGFATGQASFCATEGGPCTSATGTLVVDAFVAGEYARFDAEMPLADGTRIAFTDVELTSSWCGLVLPGCG